MNHKQLVKQIDQIVATVCERRGLDPIVGNKGGKREVAQSLVSLAIEQLTEQILELCQAGTPTANPAGWDAIEGTFENAA